MTLNRTFYDMYVAISRGKNTDGAKASGLRDHYPWYIMTIYTRVDQG